MTVAAGAVRLITVMCLSAPLAAQQDSVPERPFIRGGAFDKPFLTTLLGRAAIGGYAEFQTRLARTDGSTEEFGFEAKRFNLFTSTQVSDFVRIGAELEIEEGGEEIKLEFAAIDFSVSRAFRIRGGMLLSPLGRFNLSHDSPLNEFTDRPLVATEILGTALSEPGLGALGELDAGSGRLTYEIYAVNGFGDDLILNSPDGTRIPLGRGNLEDNNAHPSLVGRVAFSPGIKYEFGLSAHHGPYNVYSAEGVPVDDRRNLTITVLDFDLHLPVIRATGELANASIQIPDNLQGLFASGQRGAYVEFLHDFGRSLVSTMPGSFFSVGTRLDIVDFDTDLRGDDVKQITLGVNFRPTADSAAKLGFVRGRSHDRFNNPADHATLQFSLATYF